MHDTLKTKTDNSLLQKKKSHKKFLLTIAFIQDFIHRHFSFKTKLPNKPKQTYNPYST